jgi:hypothetical protein
VDTLGKWTCGIAGRLARVLEADPDRNRVTTATEQISLQRQERGALWFTLHRHGGNAILHHRHIQPVLIPDWSPTMDGITATIWASSTTGHPRTWTPIRPPAGPTHPPVQKTQR